MVTGCRVKSQGYKLVISFNVKEDVNWWLWRNNTCISSDVYIQYDELKKRDIIVRH